jgi:hypothetical protein
MIPGQSDTLDAQLAFVQGDTWGGIPSIILDPAPNYTVASARMQFRESKVAVLPAATLSTAPSASEGTITINTATTWDFTIPVQNLPLAAGTYDWQFQTTDSQGSIQTYMRGTIEVLLDVVRA